MATSPRRTAIVVAVALLLSACEVVDLSPGETATMTCTTTQTASWEWTGSDNASIVVKCTGGSFAQRSYTCYSGLPSALATTPSKVRVSCGERPAVAARHPSVAAGNQYTCALVSGGGAKCWGRNEVQQLGTSEVPAPYVDESSGAWVFPGSLTPVTVTGIAGAMAITSGGAHTCALLGTGGTIKCWGNNNQGQLGDGTSSGNGCEPGFGPICGRATPVTVTGVGGATAVAAGGGYGYGHTCALLANRTVRCWGNDNSGKLGNGAPGSSFVPTPVVGIADATAISAGASHTCALVTGGAVKCWGQNDYGELGDGSTTDAPSPVTVVGLTGAVAVAAGDGHTCALLAGGTARCWGANWLGQLGDGTTTPSPSPVTVTGLTGAAAIAASSGRTCTLGTGGAVTCWGSQSSTPVLFPGITASFLSLSPGYRASTPPLDIDHYCARDISGEIWCWGANGSGALGDGTTTDRAAPVAVVGL